MSTKFRSSRKSRRAKWLPLLIVALLVVAVGGVLLYKHHQDTSKAAAASSGHSVNPTNTVDYTPATSADNSANDARKGSSNPSPTLDSSSGPTSFSAQIVSANVSATNVHVGTLVSGKTSGDCTLAAIKSGQSSFQLGTSSVHQDVNAYSCGVFNISPQSFPVGGTWQLKLTVTSSGSSTSDTTNITITR